MLFLGEGLCSLCKCVFGGLGESLVYVKPDWEPCIEATVSLGWILEAPEVCPSATEGGRRFQPATGEVMESGS